MPFGNPTTSLPDMDGQVSSGQIADGAITTPKIGAGAVTAPALGVGAVTANALGVGAVTAPALGTGAVGYQALAVGTGNLVPDPSFEGAYALANVAGSASWSIDTTTGSSSPKSLKVDASAFRNRVYATIPVSPGDRLYIACDYKVDAAWVGSLCKVYLDYRDGAGTMLSLNGTQDVPVPGAAFKRISAQVTAPTNAVTARITVETNGSTAGFMWFDNLEVRTVVTAGVIAAGVIQAGMIAAGAVNTAALAAGAVTTPILAAGSVTATQLSATAVDGRTITGNTITGATINGTTYNGTSYIQNQAGTFFYNGTPAGGNLIAALAAVAGTDGFGNTYPAGFTVMDAGQTTFVNQIAGSTMYGQGAASTSTVAGAGYVRSVGSADALRMVTPLYLPASNSPGRAQLSASTSTTRARLAVLDDSTVTAADITASGALIKSDPSGTPYIWQAWTPAPNWANGDGAGAFQPIQYRLDGQDNLIIYGAIHTTAALASGTRQINASALPAAYQLKPGTTVAGRVPGGEHTTSAGVWVAQALVTLTTAGNVTITTPAALASGDTLYLYATIPLGNVA